MTTLYWNNICLITKFEEEYIKKKLSESNIDLNVEYFGLGRKETMIKHFNSIDDLKCDAIVSTDTDIFHDLKYRHFFEDYLPIKKFITIPLVILYNEKILDSTNRPSSFEDLLKDEYKDKVVFGGPQNSAGKSLVKSLWYRYGYDKTKDFVKNCSISSMPAGAFHKVMSGIIPIAIVPTIFALRAGVGDIKMVWPEDGAIPIHSYFGKKSSNNKFVDDFLENTLLGYDFQKLLVERAAIIPHHPNFDKTSSEHALLMDPSQEFLETINHEQLYDLLSIS